MNLLKPILEDAGALASLRRDIHAHPELGYQEERTSALIAETLSAWGIPVHRGLGGTGVVGIVRNGGGARAVGLRADIDALPVTERNTFAHASVHAGRMHACGPTATPPCCSRRLAIYPASGTSTVRCTCCSSRPKKAAVAHGR